jgi:hypothetical protein
MPLSAAGCASAGPQVTSGGLVNWPIQLRLVPPNAPFLHQADVVLVADCAAFAYDNLHQDIVRGRPVLIGCPKLDDTAVYVDKLAAILSTAQVRSLSVVRMEVPCCAGLMRIAAAARQQSGCEVPVEEIIISTAGKRVDVRR